MHSGIARLVLHCRAAEEPSPCPSCRTSASNHSHTNPPLCPPPSALQALGIPAPLVGRMLQHCPALFSYPAAERAAPLLEALMGASVGLGPTQVRLGVAGSDQIVNTDATALGLGMPAYERLGSRFGWVPC